MRYFDKLNKSELIAGLHDISAAAKLDDSNPFFHPMPDGKMIGYDRDELPILVEYKHPEVTITERVAILEASITPRNLRGAALGDQFAIDKIQAVEDEINALRE